MMSDFAFGDSILAALKYWEEQTETIDDEMMGVLERERLHLFHALAFGVQFWERWEARDRLVTGRLLTQIFPFINKRGYWRQWFEFAERVSGLLNESGEAGAVRFRLSARIGQAYLNRYQFEMALKWMEAIHTLAVSLGDPAMIAQAQYNLGQVHHFRHNNQLAESFLVPAVSYFEAVGDRRLLATSSQVLGNVARARGKYEQAINWLARSIALWREENRPDFLCHALGDLGRVQIVTEQYEVALATYHEAWAVIRETADEVRKTNTLLDIAATYYRQEKWPEALSTLQQADTVYLRQSFHHYEKAMLANHLGNVLAKLERYEEAEDHLRYGVSVWPMMEDQLNLANTLSELGYVLAMQGKVVEARACYVEAHPLFAKYRGNKWVDKMLAQLEQRLADLPGDEAE